jgi:hypothetical protein
MANNNNSGSFYQGQMGKTFTPLIEQSHQGEAYPPSAPPPTPPGGLNPYLIPDAFSYYARLKYLPYRSFPMQIRLLDAYRRQALVGAWQARWYTAPTDASVAIAAGDTLNYRMRVARGSVLWGYNFAVLPTASGGPTPLVADLRVQLVDECRNENLIAQYEIASALTSNFGTTNTPIAGFNFVMPANPVVISGGGDVLVDIVNTVLYPRYCQLLLMFLEPAGSPQ